MLKQALDNSRYKRQIQEENENNTILSDRVNKLEEKLNLIIEKLDSVENGTNKMTSHIDFINDIYSRVQIPLFWVCDRVNHLRGYKTEKQLTSSVDEQD
tara:strand:+ start:348 stop:644 length:297 start_codon:yes stop_codon:yes gene_type:complete